MNDLLKLADNDQQIMRLNRRRRNDLLQIRKLRDIAIEMAASLGTTDFTDEDCDFENGDEHWEIVNRFQRTIHEIFPDAGIKLNADNRKLLK